MPPRTLGLTDGRTIWLSTDQTVAERRCTLTHELIHLERGHHSCQPPRVERSVEAEAARRLIPTERLLATLSWARSETEAAEHLWVDTATLRARLACLTEAERKRIREEDASQG
ncbi:ImmA/IrrE family metallo-endopeptidase [Actinomyces sp. 2119]|uniref:ImmA/IrrE family metallo-endopeptidase n=2 Tax=Actinomycetaceae TaxID=2049 RepID=A0ABM6Z6Y4_9ACTO|nr:ImmA/IrrE family metallo-endopeptidase [Actinomyces lilanjuaniae]RJF42668.1 ImmA/IrrE family metallo-endopeptidase [Actinomyces sp. 2119]